MKTKFIKLFSFLTATSLALAPLLSVPPAAHASASSWQKGASIVSRWSGDFGSDSFKQSVKNAQAAGVTHISLVIPYIQSSYSSTDIRSDANAPSDDTLGAAIDYIHSLGMKVILKPHLEVSNGGWRALIEASDRDAWYANYSNILNHLGDIGKAHGAEEIVVGTELIGMASPYVNPDNTERWKTMIASLRARYSGALTYSANWGKGVNQTNEFEQIGFWPDLDYIGISAYFELAGDNTVQNLMNDWTVIDQDQISKLQAKYNKPVLFTEVGYRSVDNAHTRPWDHDMGGNYNSMEQENSYEALFQYWNNKPYFAGAILWDWSSNPDYGGPGNTDYTPQGKPAQDTIKKWFSGTGSPAPTPSPTPTPAPAPTGDWNATASSPGTVETGSAATFPVTVTSTGQATGVISDVEIYDSSNSQVFQKFYENQNISQSSPGQYSVTWTPSNSGNYVLKVGVFSGDWSKNYYWNDSTLAFAATTPGQTPPPPPSGTSTPPTTNPPPKPTSYVTDIWWPADGASVNGVQPFKAMLENKSVNDYKMYWSVDGGGQVEMWNSDADYPHKESDVDVSGWNWKGQGPYTIDFVSKDPSGATISEKVVNIYVR